MTAFFHHLTYEFRIGFRDKSQMLMNYIFPLFFYMMMGVLMTKINPGFKDYMIPGMILFTGLTGTILNMPNPLVSSREMGIFRSYRINGVPALNILFIPMLTSIAHLAVASLFILLTAGPLFGAINPISGNEANLVLVFMATAFSLASLGVLIGVIAPNTRLTVIFGQAIYLPSIMLSGIMMPISILPEGMTRISLILPTTYAMEAFRGLVWGLSTSINPVYAVIVLFAGGLTALGLAVYLFSWDSRESNKRRPPFLALLALLPFVIGAILLG
jgi:ABC-2 type transport system permease protein